MIERTPIPADKELRESILPPGYYEHIAETEVSALWQLIGRGAVSVARGVMHGRQKIVTTKAFDERQEEISNGNVITTAVHRDELDTVWLPSALESVGIHHSRPVAKEELFDVHPSLSWLLHKWGAFGVNRKDPDLNGLALVQSTVLGKGGNITNYAERTRVHQDTLQVRKIGRGPVFAAAEHDSIIVPVGIAGLSSEREGKKDGRRMIARDKRAPFGIGPKLVYAFGDPMQFGPLPDLTEDSNGRNNRANIKYLSQETKRRSEAIRDGMQAALDLAYKTRGSALEKKYL